MKLALKAAAVVGTALAATSTIASANSLADVVRDVKEVCTQPATAGEHWSVVGGVHGEAGIQIKLLKLASVSGNLNFTKEEWSGVQRVLSTAQAGDNASYRMCVQALSPQFLSKVPAQSN